MMAARQYKGQRKVGWLRVYSYSNELLIVMGRKPIAMCELIILPLKFTESIAD